MQWTTLLLICAAANTADLWVYHDTLAPTTQDRLLYEAVAEPIDSLRQRWPDHEPMRRYIDSLAAARQELRSLGEVHVQTRDEARLRFDQPTPSWALSAYEPPRPILPEAFLHPRLIVEHLTYLSKLADMGMQRSSYVSFDPGDEPRECKWLEWRTVSTVETTLGSMRFSEEIEVLSPIIAPVPTVDAERPYRVNVMSIGKDADGDDWWTVERYEVGGGSTYQLLQALDMGSGLVMPACPSEVEEPDEVELPIGPPVPLR